jgi:hypothetical protein
MDGLLLLVIGLCSVLGLTALGLGGFVLAPSQYTRQHSAPRPRL